VTIAKGFTVGKFHVTMNQFAAFVAETGFDAGKCYVLERGRRYVEHDWHSWRTPGGIVMHYRLEIVAGAEAAVRAGQQRRLRPSGRR
jgi:formylglycine-generating enzyme required for sulfatase activity